MNFVSLKSYAKINLSLRVLKKLKKIHKIETLICFINLYDEIHIKQSDHKKHEVIFNGEFSKKIPRKNTVTKLLEILDNKKLLKNKKYLIKIKKNIPQKSGLGGGSINASTILNYLIKINQLNIFFTTCLNDITSSNYISLYTIYNISIMNIHGP